MAISYESRTDLAQAAKELTYKLRDKYYPDLRDHEVTFSVLLAYNLDADGKQKDEPPLRDGDLRVLAKAKATDLISRSDENARPDAQILIDGHYFNDELPDDRREALIDGALAYFEIQLNEDKTMKTDSVGRPRFKIKTADWVLEGFSAVATRHGEAYHAVRHARKFQEEFGGVVLKQEEMALPFGGVHA